MEEGRHFRLPRESAMPCQFNQFGVSFLYPDNWTLDKEDAQAGKRSVTVFSPGGAFWSLSIYPPTADPCRLANTVVHAMQKEYEDLESLENGETIAGRGLVGYDLNFFFMDFTNTASIRCLRTDEATYAIFYQAEDHEFAQIARVFLAMTTSLLNGLGGKAVGSGQ
jgi:hypothetical protein